MQQCVFACVKKFMVARIRECWMENGRLTKVAYQVGEHGRSILYERVILYSEHRPAKRKMNRMDINVQAKDLRRCKQN
jgi:hypothetical protein